MSKTILELDTLYDRREQLCLNFALKCLKHPKFKNMFPENVKQHEMKTRKIELGGRVGSGRVGSGRVGSVLAGNNTTSWLHLASWNLPDSQLS